MHGLLLTFSVHIFKYSYEKKINLKSMYEKFRIYVKMRKIAKKSNIIFSAKILYFIVFAICTHFGY